jgi:L-aminopeptidase/D-esterase-like protein
VSDVRSGPTNSLVDVDGIRVGHSHRVGDGWLSGTTVVLAPDDGAVGGVDVRGGGPGTRETDLLDPRNLVERVHAVVLSGGSAFGLAAADGVMQRLADARIGFPVGAGDAVVPIVPGAVVFDLGRGGAARATPDASFGAAAYDDAVRGSAVGEGCVGAGTGTKVGGSPGGIGVKGAVGTSSAVLPDGTTVSALAVVNAFGSAVDPRTGELYGARHLLPGELPGLRAPAAADLAAAKEEAARSQSGPSLATTIGVLATDAALTKAQCQKLAGIGHDGLARAIDPVHTMFDGDTVFALATGRREAPDILGFQELVTAAGDVFSRAVVRGLLAATTVQTADGPLRSYRDMFPSAFAEEA